MTLLKVSAFQGSATRPTKLMRKAELPTLTDKITGKFLRIGKAQVNDTRRANFPSPLPFEHYLQGLN